MGEKVDLHIGGYHLTENIGTGGMGSVFRAVVEDDTKPLPIGSPVAVKLLHPHLRTIDEFVKRFHREARLAAMLDHENVVRIIDEGVQDNRHHYIVMELAEGLRLTDMISDGVPLSPQQTIEIMGQIADALNAAANIADPEDPGHTRSLVHRDIKPENIIIQPQDRAQYETMTNTGDKTVLANIRVKLLDFGLAKDTKALSTILSQTGQSLGTPAYMSPEQCTGGTIDTRSDIYSIGVVAYHMITGTMPFAGPTTVAYASQHAEEIPPDILKRNPLCPKNLADCIYRCLAKSPSDRYASPAELKDDLGRVAAGQGVMKISKFKKKHAISKRKALGIAAASIILAAGVIFGAQYFLNDSVRSDMDAAVQQAQVAAASGDYTGDSVILQTAMDSVGSRADHAELMAASSIMLIDINSKAYEQNASAEQYDSAVKQERTVVAERQHLANIADAECEKRTSFDTLVDKAGSCFNNLPSSGPYELTNVQQNTLNSAMSDIETALKLYPSDAQAINIKNRIQKYLDAIKPKYLTLSLGNGVEMKFVKIPAGSFLMGSPSSEEGRDEDEGPQRRVTISEPFYMGIYEVTQEQYEAVVGRHMSRYKRSGKQAPVERVDWHNAMRFCEKLSQCTGKTVTLPTEAQWEYACRAGTTSRYSFGDSDSDLYIYGNYLDASISRGYPHRDKSNNDGVEKTAFVGRYKPNSFGLYDMHGNVWEWCSDRHNSKYYAKANNIDPKGPQRGVYRVIRGGSWANTPRDCRSAGRIGAYHAYSKDTIGFRVVVSLGTDHDSIDVSVSENESLLSGESVPVMKTDIKPKQSDFQKKALTLALSSGVEMKLIKIPAGSFMMGSPSSEEGREEDEGPQRRVTISKPFYMGIYEVTQEQYEAVMGSNPSHPRRLGKQAPVENVSWNDAVAFCKKLSQQTGKTVILPTEAQWEYACRAGTITPFNTGNTISAVQANYDGDYTYGKGRKGQDRGATISVGSFLPNAFGLHDMHGNVWEWCSDWYDSKYYAKANNMDPEGPQSGSFCVLRGGSWLFDPRCCRSASRGGFKPDKPSDLIGFRVVVSPGGMD